MARRIVNEQEVLWDLKGLVIELQSFIKAIEDGQDATCTLVLARGAAEGRLIGNRDDAFVFGLATGDLSSSIHRRSYWEG